MTFRPESTDFVMRSLLLQAWCAGPCDPYLAVGAGGTGIVMLFLFLWHRHGADVRRRFFSRRPVLSEEEWFATYYPECPSSARVLVLKLLRVFAAEIGIHWSQLRPDDVFEEQICIRRRYCVWDDLEYAEEFLIEWAESAGYTVDQLPSFQGRFGDFLKRIVHLRMGAAIV